MDFNLKALGAEIVMVDRRIAAKLAEAELLLRDGEKLPYEDELNKFIRQNSFIGLNPSERLFAKCAVTGKTAECIGVMVKSREIVLAEESYYRLQELETTENIHKQQRESIQKIVNSFSRNKEFQQHPLLSEALKNTLEEKFKAAEKAGIRLNLQHRVEAKAQPCDLER